MKHLLFYRDTALTVSVVLILIVNTQVANTQGNGSAEVPQKLNALVHVPSPDSVLSESVMTRKLNNVESPNVKLTVLANADNMMVTTCKDDGYLNCPFIDQKLLQ